MKTKTLVLDTNVILDNPDVLLTKDYSIVVPYTVLSELDKLKREPELRMSVQKAFKIIRHLQKEKNITITDIPNSCETNDEKIVKTAKDTSSTLWTRDIGASVIADAQGVPLLENEDLEQDTSYCGYREIEVDYTIASNLIGINEIMPSEAEHYFGFAPVLNEYIYYKMPNDIDKYSIWRLLKNGMVTLIKQSMKPYHAAGLQIAPQDIIQACALDAVFNTDTPLAIIEGKLGTGKTILALCAALARTNGQHQYCSYDKIFVTRAPLPIDKALRIGYLPGSSDEKMAPWLAGIKSNLKFLYEKTRKDIDNKEADKVFADYFEAVNLESIQGMNIHSSILLVDEYQILSADMLKQIISRASAGAKVVLIGDPEGQVYGQNRGTEGFKKLRPFLKGSKQITYVKLDKIYRSELAEFVAEVFE